MVRSPNGSNARLGHAGRPHRFGKFIRPRHRAIISPYSAKRRKSHRCLLSPWASIRMETSWWRATRSEPKSTICDITTTRRCAFCPPVLAASGVAGFQEQQPWSSFPKRLRLLATYFRSISGEHPDWDEYRQAMIDQGKVLIRLAVERWGPLSRGGFPPRLVDS